MPLPADLAMDEPPPYTDAELDRYFDGEADDELYARIMGSRIETNDHAEWALRKLALLGETLDMINTQHDEWARRIEQNRGKLVAPLQARVHHFRGQLEDYMVRVREASGDKVKSIPLPSGKLASTGSDEAVEILDEPAVVAWIMTLPDDERAPLLSAPKPLVSQLRSRAAIRDQAMVLVRWRARLFCEHYVEQETTHADGEDTTPPWITGEELECDVCNEKARVELVELETEPVTHKVVLDVETAEPIPGLGVRPAKITPRVEVTG